MCEATAKCNLTNDCVSVKVRDKDRDGLQVMFSLPFGEKGPMIEVYDSEVGGIHFRMTPDELKTLTLGLEIMVDRLNADNGDGRWDDGGL